MNRKKFYAGQTALLVITIMLTAVYLVWRLGWTIPTDHGWLSIVCAVFLLCAELLGIFEMLVHFFTCFRSEKYQPETPEFDPEDLPDVDVFVTTCGEPLPLVEKTLRACLAMEYPRRELVHIYLCDDGAVSDMAALAERLGISYLSRSGRKDAKAGNLNNALAHSSSPLLAVFDADMCPKPDFLLKTAPYFLSQRRGKHGVRLLSGSIGYVQTPQSFYNADLFQYAFDAADRIPNEQDYFYRSLEPARNKTNSVIFGGSNTVLLRRALEDAGGFVTGTLTEDFATGIEIQKCGYTCYAIAEPLTEGLSPTSLSSLIRQRSRWARGCIKSGRKARLITCRGLTMPQRLSYIASVAYWYAPVKRLIYMLAPILFSVFGVTVMRCSFQQMLVFWAPMYLCGALGIRAFSDGIRTTKWTNIYETCLFPFLLLPVLAESVGLSKKEFVVTDKSGKTGGQLLFLLPFFAFAGLSVYGLVSVIRLSMAQQSATYLILLFWLVMNLYYLIYAMLFVVCSSRRGTRENSRLAHDLRHDRPGAADLFIITAEAICSGMKHNKKE